MEHGCLWKYEPSNRHSIIISCAAFFLLSLSPLPSSLSTKLLVLCWDYHCSYTGCCPYFSAFFFRFQVMQTRRCSGPGSRTCPWILIQPSFQKIDSVCFRIAHYCWQVDADLWCLLTPLCSLVLSLPFLRLPLCNPQAGCIYETLLLEQEAVASDGVFRFVQRGLAWLGWAVWCIILSCSSDSCTWLSVAASSSADSSPSAHGDVLCTSSILTGPRWQQFSRCVMVVKCKASCDASCWQPSTPDWHYRQRRNLPDGVEAPRWRSVSVHKPHTSLKACSCIIWTRFWSPLGKVG